MVDSSFNKKLEVILRRKVKDFVSLVSVDRLSGGASQETYRIDIKTTSGEVALAMRRSVGGIYDAQVAGRPGLATEALIIESARAAGVPEPEVYYVLQKDDELGEGFIMQWIDGEALGGRIVRSDKFAKLRDHLAYDCGKVMAKIHGIDLDETGLRDKLDIISPQDFVTQTWERYKRLQTPQPMIDYSARWLLDHLPEEHQFTLVHNDFRNGNFMVSGEEITAVLDWEIAHIGDPMRDLGWICVNSWRFGAEQPVGGFGSHEELFRGYEEHSGRKVDMSAVKFWQVFGSFWWAGTCLAQAEHYRTGPDQSVERPAIGRRSSEAQVDCVNLLIPGDVEVAEVGEITENLNMPRVEELLISVSDFLRSDVMPATKGRTSYLLRVASNSIDIVLREWQLGSAVREKEKQRLLEFFCADSQATLEQLNWRLVNALRDGSQSLDDENLQCHLRHTVVNQVAMDQPKYSGLKMARENLKA